MVSRSDTMATVNHVHLYFDTCDFHMSTSFKEYFITLNVDNTVGTLNIIYSGLTIQDTGAFKYVMLGDTVKPYTMMVKAYWDLELKHRLVSLQDIHNE